MRIWMEISRYIRLLVMSITCKCHHIKGGFLFEKPLNNRLQQSAGKNYHAKSIDCLFLLVLPVFISTFPSLTNISAETSDAIH